MKIKVTKFLKFILITYSFRALILIIGAEIYLTAKVRISPTVIKGDSKMQFRVAENLDIIAKSPNEYVVNYKTNSLGFRNEEIKKEKIPADTNQNLLEISTIDQHTKMIYENILKLEIETKGFSEQEFDELKKKADEKQINLSQIDQKVGAILEKISKASFGFEAKIYPSSNL